MSEKEKIIDDFVKWIFIYVFIYEHLVNSLHIWLNTLGQMWT